MGTKSKKSLYWHSDQISHYLYCNYETYINNHLLKLLTYNMCKLTIFIKQQEYNKK